MKFNLLILLVSITFLKNAQAIQLNCADSKNCHPAVVAIEINYPQTGPLDHCTGFLIAPDKILTNGHCVIGRVGYNGNTKRGQSCLGVSVHFFETGDYKKEEAICRSIDELTEFPVNEGINVPDYAILLLNKKINRPFIKIAQENIENEKQYKLIKVNFGKNEKGDLTATQIASEACETDFSVNVMYQPHLKTPIFTAKNCKIIPGNSGSVLLNADLNAIGLIFRSFAIAGKKVTEGDRDGYYPLGGAALNLSCLPTYLKTETDQQWMAACNGVDYIKQSILYSLTMGKQLSNIVRQRNDVHRVLLKAESDVQNFLEMSYEQRDGIGVESTAFTSVFTPQVTCVKDARKIRSFMVFPQYYLTAFLDKNYKWQLHELGQAESLWVYKGARLNKNKLEFNYSVKQVVPELKIKKSDVWVPACR